MDSIQLTGNSLLRLCGLFAEEQVLGQWFEVDLTLWLDLAAAGESDEISDTLDYRRAIETVKQLVKTAKFALVKSWQMRSHRQS
jgi:dihydroneopterin aldolase